MLKHKGKLKKKQQKFHESELKKLDVMNNNQILAMLD